jgi:hypothetical protein
MMMAASSNATSSTRQGSTSRRTAGSGGRTAGGVEGPREARGHDDDDQQDLDREAADAVDESDRVAPPTSMPMRWKKRISSAILPPSRHREGDELDRVLEHEDRPVADRWIDAPIVENAWKTCTTG